MKIGVQHPGGSFTVDAKPTQTVHEFHGNILLALGSSSNGNDFDITFAGKVISESNGSCTSLLFEHGLRNNSVVHLVIAPIRIKVDYEGQTRPISFPNAREVTVRYVKQRVRDAFPDAFPEQLPCLRKGDSILVQDDKSIIFNYQIHTDDTLVAYKPDLTQSLDSTDYPSSYPSSSSSSSSPSSSPSPSPPTSRRSSSHILHTSPSHIPSSSFVFPPSPSLPHLPPTGPSSTPTTNSPLPSPLPPSLSPSSDVPPPLPSVSVSSLDPSPTSAYLSSLHIPIPSSSSSLHIPIPSSSSSPASPPLSSTPTPSPSAPSSSLHILIPSSSRTSPSTPTPSSSAPPSLHIPIPSHTPRFSGTPSGTPTRSPSRTTLPFSSTPPSRSGSKPNTPRKSYTFDVVISIDTSGSLGSVFTLGFDLKRFFTRLLQDIPDLRIGIILHGDFLDYKACALSFLDLTSDVSKLYKFVEHATSSGGSSLQAGTYALALREARLMSWGEGRRILVVVGAGVPHPPSYTKPHLNWWEELNCLVNLGVKVYGAWYEQYENSWPFYQEIAEKTGSISVQFENLQIFEDMLLAIVYRELSREKLDHFREEVQKREQKGMGWQEEIDSLFSALALPDFEIGRAKTHEPLEPKSNAPWYNIKTDEGNVGYFMDGETGTWAHASSSYFPSDENPKMKFVLLGCRDVGKTFMLIRFANSYPHKGYYTANVEISGKTHRLSLFDSERQIDADNLYPIEYPQTDVFIVCFSLVSPPTLFNVEKWCHEIAHSHIPFLLVGTKSDLRDLIPKGLPHVTTQQGQKFAKKIGATDYVECSAKTQFGIRAVFERAMTIAMEDYEIREKKKMKEKGCIVM
eukprot:Phypoly_transcript_02396.p1 GENE.Phypoly_transcript_02396~~Phypoly_transcript_02396.p1  ORF type:complete len:850 (+),score=217.57 Phypoly_transcript_02396:49-2598(+)